MFYSGWILKRFALEKHKSRIEIPFRCVRLMCSNSHAQMAMFISLDESRLTLESFAVHLHMKGPGLHTVISVPGFL